MKIGELASAAGVNIQTVRFYERRKLLRPPLRTSSGYRDYQARDLDRLNFIRRNHEIGFTLAEIRQLLELHAVLEAMPYPLKRTPNEIKEILQLGRQRLQQVDTKIQTLTAMKRQLQRLIRHLDGESIPVTCPEVRAGNSREKSQGVVGNGTGHHQRKL